MNSITINQFTNKLQNLIKQVINQHTSLKITNQDGANFVVIQFRRLGQQETLAILQNNNPMEKVVNLKIA